MPLLDHFHPPLHNPRRWTGFVHAWGAFIVSQLNLDTLPPDYFAELSISVGPHLEDDETATASAPPAVGITHGSNGSNGSREGVATAAWSPPPPRISVAVEFTRLDCYEIRVYQDLGGREPRAAIELVSPANKDRPGARRTFAAKCAGYLKHGVGLVIVDVVTSRDGDLHAELFDALEVSGRQPAWRSDSGLYAVAYRPVTVRKRPRVEAWPEPLTLGSPLPVMPPWLASDLCVPVRLEDSYLTTCRSLRIAS